MKKRPGQLPFTVKVPYACRILMAMAITYYGIINLLFLGMLVFSGRIRQATEPWFEKEGFSAQTLLIFIIIGLTILFMCTFGIFLMMRKRKGGFFLFLAGAIILWIADFFLLDFDWIRYLTNSGFIFILGILHFSKRCYGKPTKKQLKRLENQSE